MSKHEVKTLETGLLVRELRDVEWDTLGTYLGLSQGEIKEIEGNYQNIGRRRIEMFQKWLSKEVNPSWEKVIAALEDMSENSIASQLRKKYVYQQQPRDECQTDSPKAATDDQQVTEKVVLEVDKQDQVARELESLEKKYLRLVIDARSTMEAANLSVIELESFSQFYLNKEVTTVKELFQLIKPFCFLDYSLLETAITFLIDPAHKVVSDLREYVKQLTNFKASTMLENFMQSIENAQKSLTTKEGTGACTVILRLVGGWLTKTMDDLDKLLKEIFQDKSSVLAHIRIIKGSIIVTYLAPQSEADSLVKLAQTKLSFMLQVGVCGLDIGQRTVISEVTTHNFSFQFSLIKAVVDNDINLLTFLLNITLVLMLLILTDRQFYCMEAIMVETKQSVFYSKPMPIPTFRQMMVPHLFSWQLRKGTLTLLVFFSKPMQIPTSKKITVLHLFSRQLRTGTLTLSVFFSKPMPIPTFREMTVLHLFSWQLRTGTLTLSLFFSQPMPIPTFREMTVLHLFSWQLRQGTLTLLVFFSKPMQIPTSRKITVLHLFSWQLRKGTLTLLVFFSKPMPIPTFRQLMVPHLFSWQLRKGTLTLLVFFSKPMQIPTSRKVTVLHLFSWQIRKGTLTLSIFFSKPMPIPTFRKANVFIKSIAAIYGYGAKRHSVLFKISSLSNFCF